MYARVECVRFNTSVPGMMIRAVGLSLTESFKRAVGLVIAPLERKVQNSVLYESTGGANSGANQPSVARQALANKVVENGKKVFSVPRAPRIEFPTKEDGGNRLGSGKGLVPFGLGR